MSGPVLQFNLDNFKYKVIHNGTHITGFNIRTGGLNSGDYGGHDYSVYAYFSDVHLFIFFSLRFFKWV